MSENCAEVRRELRRIAPSCAEVLVPIFFDSTMSAEHETTTVVLCGSSVLWSDSAFFLPAPGRNDIDGRNELFVLSAFDSSAAASSPSLGFGAAPSRVTTICTTPFASRSSCAPCCGVVTGRPLTTWTTSPILSFFDRAASPPGRISATTTPLRVASAGGSNVRPKTSVSDGFQMSISFGTGFLPCRKDESARPNVDTERAAARRRRRRRRRPPSSSCRGPARTTSSSRASSSCATATRARPPGPRPPCRRPSSPCRRCPSRATCRPCTL